MSGNIPNYEMAKFLLDAYFKEKRNNRQFVQSILQFAKEIQSSESDISNKDVMERLLFISLDEHKSSGILSNDEALKLWQEINSSVISAFSGREGGSSGNDNRGQTGIMITFYEIFVKH